MPAVTAPPRPRLCRLERLEKGEWKAVGTVSLLHPERYAERLAAKGKAGRAIELDERLQPGRVHAVDVKNCPVCGDPHAAPYDGSCLL